MRILLAEDDQFLANGLQLVLKDSGYAIDLAVNGADADSALLERTYDLLILDIGLPVLDGFEILRRVRGRGQSLPILVLTARDRIEDRVSGLDLGANDYLTKPFQLPELEARIRALLRKDHWDNRTEVTFASLRYNTATRVTSINGQSLDLSARELSLLEVLLQRLGRMLSKDQIADLLSVLGEELSNNAIGISIHRLRKKLEEHGITIRSIRGLGYRLERAD